MDVKQFTHQTGCEAADPGHVSLAMVCKLQPALCTQAKPRGEPKPGRTLAHLGPFQHRSPSI